MKNLTLLLALTLTACATTSPTPTPTPEAPSAPVEEGNPVVPVKCAPKTWCFAKETKEAIQKYGKNLLAASPSEYALYCGKAAKVDCYAELIHAMSYYESGYDPKQVYVESFSDAKGAKVQSTGLLQVSIESCKSYGASAKTTEDLKSVEKNLECGVRILDRWISRDGVISGGSTGAWKGGARYWSVLRKHVAEIRAKALGWLR